MARFYHRRSSPQSKKMLVSLALFLAVAAVFFYCIDSFSADSLRRQEENLENALQRGVISCYAAEGTYPPDLSYLKEHYGVTWNEDLFFVDYRVTAANIYPEITIIPKKGEVP